MSTGHHDGHVRGHPGGSGGNNRGPNGGRKTGGGKGSKGGGTHTSVSTPSLGTSTSSAAPTNTALNTTSNVAGGGGSNSGLSQTQITNLQTSLQLDPSQIQPGLRQDGQGTPEAGQVPSATSSNNFINHCATLPGTPLTNGLQIKTGSCNPTTMGSVVASSNIPSSKFTFPQNFGTIPANKTFTITMAINHMQTGNFVNAQANYFAAPCQVNGNGDVLGHSHVVVQALDSITQTTILEPTVFAFFKGLNAAAANGILSAQVPGGLAPGHYRLASINTCANHQPVLVSIAQRGQDNDIIYFTAQ